MRKNIDIIQSKLTNNITNKYKKQIWEEITKHVNAVGKANRTVQEVKDKWENLHSTEKNKTKTKQKKRCNFSKDGFHHQPLALDEHFSTRQSHC